MSISDKLMAAVSVSKKLVDMSVRFSLCMADMSSDSVSMISDR